MNLEAKIIKPKLGLLVLSRQLGTSFKAGNRHRVFN